MSRSIKARLARNDILIGTVINITNAMMVELCCGAGADFLFLDFEHGLRDYGDIAGALIAADMCDTPALVRLGERSANLVARMLDAGAAGLIFPHVRTADEARELVSWCRYKPQGVRGSGLARGFLRHHGNEFDRRQQASADVVCIMIVEDLEGARNLPEILGVEGVTGVAIGPGDLSMELGADRWDDPRVTKVLDDMAAVIRGHKGTGMLRLCLNEKDVPDLVDAGANMIILTHDAHLIKAMYKDMIGKIGTAITAHRAATS
jgi:2-keto-3-deoxy-L-rhamnonate aldolase RhmA